MALLAGSAPPQWKQLHDLLADGTPIPKRLDNDHPSYPRVLLRRIVSRVDFDENGCWLWTGCLSKKGYGHIRAYGRTTIVHRLTYEMFVGEISEGHELDHLCRVRHCVNPKHLEAVTHAENIRRGQTGITWASRTHCANGHEFTPENTFQRDDSPGGRGCRTCRAERTRLYRLRNLELCRLRDRIAARKKRERAKGFVVEHETTGKGAAGSRYRLVNSLSEREAPCRALNGSSGVGGPGSASPSESGRTRSPLDARSNPPGLAALAVPSTPGTAIGAFPQTSASPGTQLTLDVAV